VGGAGALLNRGAGGFQVIALIGVRAARTKRCAPLAACLRSVYALSPTAACGTVYTATARLPGCAGMSLEGLGDLVADRDRAAGEDVGSKAAAMDERPKQSKASELLKVGTGFCESSPNALDRPYMEPLADECVQ
jgi:hypothetical protein